MSSNPFRIAASGMAGAPFQGDDLSADVAARIERMVGSSDVFLFMKGSPDMPRCGFSANTVAILEQLGAPYATFDVLADEEVRSGVKQYSQWPTFPQLYVRGELVGGNDIVSEMFASGELASLLRRGAS